VVGNVETEHLAFKVESRFFVEFSSGNRDIRTGPVAALVDLGEERRNAVRDVLAPIERSLDEFIGHQGETLTRHA
jgi:hypothetical protein